MCPHTPPPRTGYQTRPKAAAAAAAATAAVVDMRLSLTALLSCAEALEIRRECLVPYLAWGAFLDLEALHLLNHLVELALGRLVPLLCLLVLCLPLVSLLLDSLHLALKVFRLDVHLAQLLRRLPQVLLGSVQLALKQCNLALQAVGVRPAALLLLLADLGIRKLGLGLLEVTLGERKLVRQAGNLLVLEQQLLLKLLDAGLGRLGTLLMSVSLGTQSVEFLCVIRAIRSVACLCQFSVLGSASNKRLPP